MFPTACARLPVDNPWPSRAEAVIIFPVKAASAEQLASRTPGSDGVARASRDGRIGAGPPESPAASRAPRRSWKDPRLLVGVVIVAVCVLSGARILAGADDTVPVWSVRVDRAAGEDLGRGDLQRVDLRFATPDLAQRYVSADDELPADAVLTREVAAGELLPRAALGSGPPEYLAELPVALPADAVPASLRSGELVDVWVTPAEDSGAPPRAVRILRQVRVVAVPRTGGAFGPSATRQVVVGVTEEDENQLGSAIAQLATGTPLLVRRG